MRSILVVLALFLFPNAVSAATVGFVPSTGLWFSTTTFSASQPITLYTVVINNDYPLLDGVVGFYDNETLITTTPFTSLTKEQAVQLKAVWQPSSGEHAVQARLESLLARTLSGATSTVPLEQTVRSTGSPLTLGAKTATPVTVDQVAAAGSAGSGAIANVVLGSVALEVVDDGAKKKLSPQVLGEKIVAMLTASPQNTSTTDESSFQEVLDKNRQLLNRAEDVASTITTTAGRITSAYNQTKSAIAQGEAWYYKFKEYTAVAAPYFEGMKRGWLVITDNNEPKRVAAAVLSIVVLYLILKWVFRRDRYNDRYNY
jgi:hypothetical protein